MSVWNSWNLNDNNNNKKRVRTHSKALFYRLSSDAQEEDWGQSRRLEKAIKGDQLLQGDIQEAPSISPDPSLIKRKSLKPLKKQGKTFCPQIQEENLSLPQAKFISLVVQGRLNTLLSLGSYRPPTPGKDTKCFPIQTNHRYQADIDGHMKEGQEHWESFTPEMEECKTCPSLRQPRQQRTHTAHNSIPPLSNKQQEFTADRGARAWRPSLWHSNAGTAHSWGWRSAEKNYLVPGPTVSTGNSYN